MIFGVLFGNSTIFWIQPALFGGAPGIEETDEDADSLKIPEPENPMRKLCFKIVEHSYFDTFILICIAANCFFMAIEDPHVTDDDAKGNNLYFNGNGLPYLPYKTSMMMSRILLYIFTVEAMLKNLGYTPWGYLFGPDASWNRLDFFIVVVGWLEAYPLSLLQFQRWPTSRHFAFSLYLSLL